jgi:hypothetical protein
MERDLLIRRWPERRAVVLAAAAAAFVAVVAATRAADDPALGLMLLNVLPVTLVALELGLWGGLLAAAAAIALVLVNDAGGHPELEPLGVVTRSLAFLAVGAIAGRFSDRMRDAQHRDRRLLESGLALASVPSREALATAVAETVLRTPGATGAVVEVEGGPVVRAGRWGDARPVASIAARGATLGRIELAHRSRLMPEEAAALELLAVQAGLAADNQRLLEREREAATAEAALLRVATTCSSSARGLATCSTRRKRTGGESPSDCMGVLSWLIEQGAADGTDLSGLPVALACRYSDDEPGSPWTWTLYLDARASSEQWAALEGIFTGRLGGDAERHFPWAWKASELVAVRRVEIEVDHTLHRQRLWIRDRVSVRIRDRYAGDETVTCVIPGHERAGEELVADELVVEDGALAFNYRGVCGYGSTFEYAG